MIKLPNRLLTTFLQPEVVEPAAPAAWGSNPRNIRIGSLRLSSHRYVTL
jgi:hypothetical protein